MARALGHDVWPMRLPPVVFGTLVVPLFYLLVRRLARRTPAAARRTSPVTSSYV
jgi:4-amino-4-deoxy-L-arabinose transferase-like glycosyltransferase